MITSLVNLIFFVTHSIDVIKFQPGSEFEYKVNILQLYAFKNVLLPILIVFTFFYFKSEFEIFNFLGLRGYIQEDEVENAETIVAKKSRFWEQRCIILVLMIMTYLLCQDSTSKSLFAIGMVLDFGYYVAKIYAAN